MSSDKTNKKRSVGCLIPLGLYVVVLTVGFFVTRPPLITGEFPEATMRSFSIAIVEESGGGFAYARRALQTIQRLNPELPSPRFLLPEPRITIDVGDIHHAEVLEEHGDWQLIEFNYSNTYMATSIYRAYADRVEPVSYQMTSSVGDAMVAMMLTIVAVALYLLAVLINFIRNRRARKIEVS